MNIFYKPDIKEETLVLDPEESMHCSRVLRSRIGDRIQLIDGRGGYYEAEIMDNNPKATHIQIINKQLDYKPLPYMLHMAIAPTKNMDRFEWFIEKATEIGISRITPILCTRSERKHVRTDRLVKVMIAAAKQSEKAYFPIIDDLVPYKEWIRKQQGEHCYIAHCMEGEVKNLSQISIHDSLTVAVGPEGDFTPEEVDAALEAGFGPLSLGTYRLRTETAGIYVCAAVSYAQQ